MEQELVSQRYATRGIVNKIDILLQMYLWQLIEKRKQENEEIDYLQIFELSVEKEAGKSVQKILHRQEEPEYKCEHYLNSISEPITCKIWVIDSGEYWTMLFPEEY